MLSDHDLAIVLVVLLFFAFLVVPPIVMRINDVKQKRFRELGDECDFDEWKRGSPDQEVDEDARPTDFR